MRASPPRRAAVFATALAAMVATLLAPATTAAADDYLTDGQSALGISQPGEVVTIRGTGDITKELASAVRTPGTAARPRVVELPAGSFKVTSVIIVKDHVYLVAQPGTVVTLAGTADQMLWFSSVTSGVSGGTWDGAKRGTSNVFAAKASTVAFTNLTIRNAGKNGIAAYLGSDVTLRSIRTTGNKRDGAYLEASKLTATGVTATYNRRNGIQLSSRSAGTITSSQLDYNGQAVSGSTTGKTGHGLGVASSATVRVEESSISRNKVCGVSLTGSAAATIEGSALDRNGRHGLGTTAGTTATITDSTAISNGYNGVLASGSGTAVALTKVTITGTRKYGLSVPSRGSATVRQSVISGSGKINISVSSRGRATLFGDNVIQSAKSHGIAVSGKGQFTVTGTGNLVQTNRGNGLLVSGKGTTGRINDPVTFSGNRKRGILVNSKAKLTMVPCTFTGNKTGRTAKTSGGRISVVALPS